MKKVEIILIAIVGVLATIVLISMIFFGRQKPVGAPSPIQVFSPSPKSSATPSLSKELEDEKTAQENYAKARQEFLQTHSWLLKTPIKSDNYFVSYDPGTDTVFVELYYLANSAIPKEDQLQQAKQAAVTAMAGAGIDINNQKIEYLELEKKQ